MFNFIIHEKNRLRFNNLFRKNVESRNQFLCAYTWFLRNRGCCCGFIFEIPSLAVMADRIFDDMLKWDIHSFSIDKSTGEVMFSMNSVIYVPSSLSKSQFQENIKLQESFMNP